MKFEWNNFVKPVQPNNNISSVICQGCWNTFDYCIAYEILGKLYCPFCAAFESVVIAHNTTKAFNTLKKIFYGILFGIISGGIVIWWSLKIL